LIESIDALALIEIMAIQIDKTNRLSIN